MRTVTKKEVAKRVAKMMGQKIYITEQFVNSVFQALREILSEADPEIRIEIRDFGVFEVKETKPKPKARNPRTGEIIYVPARRKTHFKPGKLLKDILKRPLDEQKKGDDTSSK
ncbi:MAG: integration host factor subunit beta [Calditrichaeota bacterium]|nr:MAG: integration host factor subunit beta [Calditrichota bacterium]